MSDVFSFDESVAQQAAQDVIATGKQFESTLSELQTQVNETKANWEGDEKEQYAALQAELDAAAAQCNEGISTIGSLVTSSSETFGQMRSKVRGTLGG